VGRKGTAFLGLLALAIVALLVGDAATGFLGVVPRGPPDAATPADVGTDADRGHASLRGAPPQPAARGDDAGLPPPVDLAKVDRDLDLHGVVVTRDEKPIAGAAVTAVAFPWRRASLLNHDEYDDEVERGRTRSAADGTFAIRLLRGEEVRLRASAEGFADVEKTGCQAGERVKLTMTSGVRLLVVAKDEGGNPLEALRLRLIRADHVGAWAFSRRGTTDAKGEFAFERLQGDSWGYLATEHDRLANLYFERVDLPASGEVRREIVVPAGRTITGRVTDEATGAPIAGAKVGSNWTMDRPVAVDAEGRYTFPGWLGRNVMTLTAHADGYGYTSSEVKGEGIVDFRLRRGFAVRGRALDAATKALPDLQVAAIAYDVASNGQHTSMAYGRTAADGRFALGGLDPRTAHALVLMGKGVGRTLLEFEPPEKGDVLDLGDVPVHRARAIEGTVVDADDRPIADASVELSGANDDRKRLRGSKSDSNMDYGEQESRRTDDLGRFRFPDLASGTYALRVEVSGRPEIERDVVLTEERDERDVVVRLGKGHPLRVIVRDETAGPVPEAFVEVIDVEHGSVRRRTDAAGVAEFALEKPAKTVEVHPYGLGTSFFAPPAVRIRDDREEVVVQVERAGVAKGTLFGPDGKALGMALLDVRRGERVLESAWTSEDGRFEAHVPLSGLVSIVYDGMRLEGSRTFRAVQEGRVDGVVAGATGVEIHARALVADRSIAVRALGPDGAPLPHVVVTAGGFLEEDSGLSVVAGDDALARFSALPAIPTQFKVWPPKEVPDGRVWLPGHVDDVVPADQQIEVRVREGWWMRGRVVDASGAPAPGAQVTIVDSPDSMRVTTTGADGRFSNATDPDVKVVRVSAKRQDATGVFEATASVRREDGEVTLRLQPVR
jgi:protocatechuate 3,4-dioxygenase beta subunit